MWAIFQAIKRSWAQHFVSQASGLIILSITYAAALFLALALVNIQTVFDIWGQLNEVTVYLDSNNKAAKAADLEKFLAEHSLVREVAKVDSKQSAAQFNERFSQLSSQKIDTEQLSTFFPEYLVISLNQTVAYKSGAGILEAFATSLTQKFPQVKEVSYGKDWLRKYISLLTTTQNVGWLLILVFIVASMIVSSSVIKTILFDRREEVEIMEFIGADDSRIYLPQLISVLLLATLAFCMALLINYTLFAQFTSTPGSLLSPMIIKQLHFIPLSSLISLFVVCLTGVGLFSLWTIYSMMPRRKQALLLKEVSHSE